MHKYTHLKQNSLICMTQGGNGKGALVLHKGRWMKPQEFEEACGVKGKVWRCSLK